MIIHRGFLAFDVTPNVSDGKVNVAIDFTNKIKRSGIDYTVFILCFFLKADGLIPYFFLNI